MAAFHVHDDSNWFLSTDSFIFSGLWERMPDNWLSDDHDWSIAPRGAYVSNRGEMIHFKFYFTETFINYLDLCYVGKR